MKENVLSVLKEIRDYLKPKNEVVKEIAKKRFTKNPDGTVTDNKNNLIWYPTFDKKYNWEDAKKKCKEVGGRLPTIDELLGFMEYDKENASVYWSATGSGATGAYYVYFSGGGVGSYGKASSRYVRAVRTIK